MPDQINTKRDTAANWASENPVIALGEAGYDITNNQIRYGNGIDTWSALTPVTRDAAKVVGPNQAGTGAANTAIIQAALTAATPGTTIRIAPGSYTVDLVNHPNDTAGGFGNCALAIKSGTTLDLTGVTLTLGASSLVRTDAEDNRFITNWKMEASGTPDSDITIIGGTLDGNSGVVANATLYKVHGIQFWRVNRPRVIRTVVSSCHGTNTSTVENFHVDFNRCKNFLAQDVTAFGGAGDTATLFSANYSQGGRFVGCEASSSSAGHGFTLYSVSDVSYFGCRSYDNFGKGFNCEHSWNVDYTGCNSGGVATSVLDSGAGVPSTFTVNDNLGNGGPGFQIQLDKGGGNINLKGCTGIGNTADGLFIMGSVAATATVGTTGSTIVLSSSTIAWKQMVGRYVTVNAGTPVRITAVDEGTETITTSAAHGGASGNEVVIFAGKIDVANCVFDRNDSYGVEFGDTGTPAKLASISQTRFRSCSFRGNTSGSMAGVGNGSTSVIAELEPNRQLVSTLSSNWSTGNVFRNPFPFDCMVLIIGATGATSLGGFGFGVDSTGTNSGPFTIPAGSSFTATSATAPRFYPTV